jgi:CRP/FNR family transcriptional regulator
MIAHLTHADLARFLRGRVYFDDLEPATLDLLAGQSVRRTFVPGEMIIIEGEPTSGLWMIESGRVRIFKISPGGTELVLHLLGEGETFNDISALDGGNNAANAAALSHVVAWLLPVEALHEALLRDNALALNVIRGLTGRIRRLVSKIEDLSLYSVTVRLARFLLNQVADPSLSGPGVTRTAIAAYLNTTPQTISNTLRELEQAGAIRFDRHRIMIVREDILREIALV